MNVNTVKDVYPLPRISEIFDEIHGAKYFASLDLLMGYHQIGVKAEDRQKTAFITHKGLFVFNRIPFGLCNSPATFQRLMDRVFPRHLFRNVLAYLDDLLIFARTEEELLAKLEETLRVLASVGLKCKTRKCKLFRPDISYLGYVISKDGISPDLSKIEKIRQWPFPLTGLGMMSFWACATIIELLFPVLRSGLLLSMRVREILRLHKHLN